MRSRLPLPSRNLPPDEVARVRGAGDAQALKLAYHEERIHRQLQPGGTDASAVFEAAEQARVEAIGALAMRGVKANLAANVTARCDARGFAKVHLRSEVPIADALGLMVRERLTGETPPESARYAVDLWREFIEQKAGPDLARLEAALRDQRAFGKITRAILKDLEMADDLAEETEDAGGEDKTEPESQPDEGSEGADAKPSEGSEAELGESEGETSDDVIEMDAEHRPELSSADDSKEGMRPWRPEIPFSNQDRVGLQNIHPAIRRND